MCRYIIKQGNINDVVLINSDIKEFDTKFSKTHFINILRKVKDPLVIVAYTKKHPIGFQIAYTKDTNIILWCAAVNEKYRRQGIMTKLISYIEQIGKTKHIQRIITDISNGRTEILHLLIKNNFHIYDFQKSDNALDNKIFFEKLL